MADEEVMEVDECRGLSEQGDLKSEEKFETKWETRLKRFMCFGTTRCIYDTKTQISPDDHEWLRSLIDEKGTDVVQIVHEYSVENRACKQNPILYTLALCCRSKNLQTKMAAYGILSQVCRIPTHLFQFVSYCEKVSAPKTGWGRAHRRAISKWYTSYCKKEDGSKKEDGAVSLARHLTKYRSRYGWRHKDLFRLSHIKPDPEFPELKYLVILIARGKNYPNLKKLIKEEKDDSSELKKVMDFMDIIDKAQKCTDAKEMRLLIMKHDLRREHVPTKLLNSKEVWQALIKQMPMTAMIRNLGKMTSLDIFEQDFEKGLVIDKLKNEELLEREKIHPFCLFVALSQYKKGEGDQGNLKWNVNHSIADALNGAFYLSFKNVVPTKKRFLLAVDVSESMDKSVMGTPTISARDAAIEMMMLTVRTEGLSKVRIITFAEKYKEINISDEDDHKDVRNKCYAMADKTSASTDCSQPIKYAMEPEHNKYKYDVFIIYTASETSVGNVHPSKALQNYRTMSGIKDARLIVCGMTSTGFTIADPEDEYMMDIVGFDKHAPQAIHQFIMEETIELES